MMTLLNNHNQVKSVENLNFPKYETKMSYEDTIKNNIFYSYQKNSNTLNLKVQPKAKHKSHHTIPGFQDILRSYDNITTLLMERYGRNPYKPSELPFWYQDDYNMDKYIGGYYSNHKSKLHIDKTENQLVDELKRDWSAMQLPEEKHYSSAKILKTWDQLYLEQRNSIPDYNLDGTIFGKEYVGGIISNAKNLQTIGSTPNNLVRDHSFGVNFNKNMTIDRSPTPTFMTPQKEFISKSGSLVRPFREKTSQEKVEQQRKDKELYENMKEIEERLKKMNKIK